MKLTTENGYDLFEVASALQKTIRRGLEEEAMFWALELEGRYGAFLWKRLAVIASEDVGPADSSIAVLIHALYDHYREAAKGSTRPQERIILAHAVLVLCRAPKSRIADNLACVVSHQRDSEGLRREIPDVALDQHTRRGQRRGRGLEHWATEGCQLAHEVAGLDVYAERALAMRQRHGRLRPKAKGRRGRQPEQLALDDDPEEEA